MSAPPSGSANGSTTAGYYPDPSIPGYVRYWDGGSWVPGTSRPEPRPGEPMPAAPGEEPPAEAASAEPEDAAPTSEPADAVPAQRAEVLPPAPQGAPVMPQTPPAPGEPPAQGALPELRPRGDVDLHSGQQVTDWDDPSRLHGQRPEAATAWQADSARQAGFGGEQDQRVSWGSDGTGQQPGGDPRDAGWSRPQAAPPGEAPAVTAAPQPPQLQPGSAPQQPAVPAQSPPPAQAAQPTPPAQPKPVVHEQTTQLRRSDIIKARRMAREAQAQQGQQQGQQQQVPQQAPPPPHQAQPPTSLPAQPAPHLAPGAQPAGEPGWPQQVRELAQPGPHAGGPQPHGAADGLAAPWRPPASDPFLQAAQNQARPAGLGRRIAARLIDSLITAAVGAAVALPLLPKARDHIDAKVAEIEQAGVTQDIWLVDGTTGLYLAMVIGAVLVFGLLYEALPNARWGRTLGKKLLGLRVLSMDEQEPPGYGRAIVRWLVQGTLSFLVIGVVNLMWAFFDKPWRQCWHDKAAGTFTAEGGGEVRLG